MKLAGKPVTFEDFRVALNIWQAAEPWAQGVAPSVAASIDQIQAMDCSEDEFEDLCLVFSFTLLGGSEVELLPGGSQRPVELADRDEFCRLARLACLQQFDAQIELLRSGLDDYKIPQVALLLWTASELQEQESGGLVAALLTLVCRWPAL